MEPAKNSLSFVENVGCGQEGDENLGDEIVKNGRKKTIWVMQFLHDEIFAWWNSFFEKKTFGWWNILHDEIHFLKKKHLGDAILGDEIHLLKKKHLGDEIWVMNFNFGLKPKSVVTMVGAHVYLNFAFCRVGIKVSVL